MATFSALAKWAAKYRRKCLFEAQFANSSINCKRNSLLLRNYSKAALESFPWTQSATDIYPRDPFLHCLCGSWLLYQLMKRVPDGHNILHPKEFLKSVKDCILLVSEMVCQMDPDKKLTDLLGSRLDKFFKEAFATVFDHKLNVHLEVSDVSNLEITAVHTIAGPLEPSSDCYVIDPLPGQWMYIDPADAENFKMGSIDEFKKLAKSTLNNGLRIQIGVKFLTKEKFYIAGSDGEIFKGSTNSVSSHHMWLFESPVDYNKLFPNTSSKEFPLSWIVADMDKTVHRRLPEYRPFLSIFK